MKPLLLSGMAALVVGGIIISTQSSVEEYVAEPLIEVQELEPVVELDVIDQAKQELDRINAELDTKEQELLDQRSKIDAELERLRETRAGF
jgi:CMP-2-keto-3-deoxyoctulosonic acid synthetase